MLEVKINVDLVFRRGDKIFKVIRPKRCLSRGEWRVLETAVGPGNRPIVVEMTSDDIRTRIQQEIEYRVARHMRTEAVFWYDDAKRRQMGRDFLAKLGLGAAHQKIVPFPQPCS